MQELFWIFLEYIFVCRMITFKLYEPCMNFKATFKKWVFCIPIFLKNLLWGCVNKFGEGQIKTAPLTHFDVHTHQPTCVMASTVPLLSKTRLPFCFSPYIDSMGKHLPTKTTTTDRPSSTCIITPSRYSYTAYRCCRMPWHWLTGCSHWQPRQSNFQLNGTRLVIRTHEMQYTLTLQYS